MLFSLYEHEVDLKKSCSEAILLTEKKDSEKAVLICLPVFEMTSALLSHSRTLPRYLRAFSDFLKSPSSFKNGCFAA